MKKIFTTKGEVILVDDKDFKYLSKYKWWTYKGYVKRTISILGKTKNIRMHREILNATEDQIVDHINGNKLDNQKNNLRFCSYTENARNRKIHSNNTSGFKGVFKSKTKDKWNAQISINGKNKHLGTFLNLKSAIKVYNFNTHNIFGSFFRK